MTMDIVSVFGSPTVVLFGAGGIGFVLGYAVKKVAKILAVTVGLFFMGLAYMDYNGWVKVNWQTVSNSTNTAATNGTASSHNDSKSYSNTSTKSCSKFWSK